MFVCSSAAAVRASRKNRSTSSRSKASVKGRTLIATSRSSWRSRARYTMPIPPRPSSSRISYSSSSPERTRSRSVTSSFRRRFDESRLLTSGGPGSTSHRLVLQPDALEPLTYQRDDEDAPHHAQRGSPSQVVGAHGDEQSRRCCRRMVRAERRLNECGHRDGHRTRPYPRNRHDARRRQGRCVRYADEKHHEPGTDEGRKVSDDDAVESRRWMSRTARDGDCRRS